MGRRHLREARRQQRRICLHEIGNAADGEGPRRGPMVPALQRDDLVLVRVPADEPVVPGDLHRPFVRLGAAHRKERVGQVARRKGGELGRQLGGGPVGELAGRRVVRQAHRLLRDGLGDLPAPVPHVHHRQTREGVHHLLALLGPEPDALPPIDQELLVGQPRVVLRLVRPQVPDHLAVDHGITLGRNAHSVNTSAGESQLEPRARNGR